MCLLNHTRTLLCTYSTFYTGGIVPFSNPIGILIFVEDSVQTINLTLLSNGTIEVGTVQRH